MVYPSPRREPLEPLTRLLERIQQINNRDTALEILESLLHWSERILTADTPEAAYH